MMTNKALEFRLDTDVNALYIRFMPGKVEQTVEWEDLVYIDLDAEGQPVGIEFVNADDFVPFLRRHKGNLDLPEEVSDHLRNTFR